MRLPLQGFAALVLVASACSDLDLSSPEPPLSGATPSPASTSGFAPAPTPAVPLIVSIDASSFAPTIDYFGLGWFQGDPYTQARDGLLSHHNQKFWTTQPVTSVTTDILVFPTIRLAAESYAREEERYANRGKAKAEVGQTSFRVRTGYLATLQEQLFMRRHNVVVEIELFRDGFALVEFDFVGLAKFIDRKILAAPLVAAPPHTPPRQSTGANSVSGNGSMAGPTPIVNPTSVPLRFGEKIAFTSSRGSNPPWQVEDVYAVNADGTGLTRLTNGHSVSDLVWSPDGAWVALDSVQDGNVDIYSVAVLGAAAQRLTTDPAGDRHPTWSPDGSEIAFRSERDRSGRSIYVVHADGTGLRRVVQHTTRVRDPAWSPTGAEIAFVSIQDFESTQFSELYVVNADGSGLARIAGDQPDWDDKFHQISFLAWSPHGSKIAFAGDPHGRGGRGIWIVNVDGTGLNRLADGGQPAWSPDGSRIAFTSFSGGDDIYVTNADGTSRTRLTDHPADDQWPTWSPDGSRIAFMSRRDRNWEIYVMNADGSDERNLTRHPAADRYPSWEP